MMTTSAGTVRPAKVVIMGSGVAGLQAIATAKKTHSLEWQQLLLVSHAILPAMGEMSDLDLGVCPVASWCDASLEK